MRVILIINTSAGKRDTTAKLAAIHTACRDLGVSYQVLCVGGDGSFTAAVRRVLDQRPDRVLVCGGDGTVTRIGTSLLRSGIPIGALPGGTANSIARAIGVPTRLTDAARFALLEEPRPFDAVRVNDRISLLTSGAGFDSDVVATADGEMKRRFGVLAYVWSFMTNLGGLAGDTVFEVEVDGAAPVQVPGDCLLIANIGHLFGEFDLFLDSRPDDGKVDVAVLTLSALAEIVTLSARSLTGRKLTAERSAFFHGHSVRVRFSRNLRTQIDGEVGGKADVMHAEVLPGALQMIFSGELRKPRVQVPPWLEAVADNLMGLGGAHNAAHPGGASAEPPPPPPGSPGA